MKGVAHNCLQRIWYEGDGWFRALLPLAGLYWLLISLRRFLYRCGVLRTHRAQVPVIVVGNITAGGTGKTPTTVWLTRELRARGFTPGVVSRGYGGSKSGTSMRVDARSDPAVVGDEPVLIAMRTGCTVVVDANRARAASMLVDDGADLIIADDGLQHYALDRNYEICVIDGSRGLGNGLLLPAGPMRETVTRIEEVDQVLVNGRLRQKQDVMSAGMQNAIEFELIATEVCRLNGSLTRPIERFSGTTVHAVAAIGNPVRFFDLLRSHGIQVIEHAYLDHARIRKGELDFGDDFDILMTEKDAVKFDRKVSDRFWYVPVDLAIDPVIAAPWLEQIESRMRDEQSKQ
ncbi:MAG: tetraacyldisaccharide 4'-kinase [Woeseiaceae bacterium]|nr:tetraacyldisaccharide 4'-kinase [Woeseiaceae bacterium]